MGPSRPPSLSEAALDRVAAELPEQGWSVCPGAFDAATVGALAAEVRALHDADALRQARIGRGEERQLRTAIRGDCIRWLDPAQATNAQDTYFASMEALRLALNRALFLGLFEFNAHYAVYPAGASYGRHLDAFRDHGAGRALSCVLYLNPDWNPAWGGHLRLYLDGDRSAPYVDVVPEGGTLVTFLSERFEHEVRPATAPRLSLTGWFTARA